MKKFAIGIFLIISFHSFSQTNETDCVFPSNEILPEKFKDCEVLREYFEENIILERDSSGLGYFIATCNLYSNGKLSDIKQNFLWSDKKRSSNSELINRLTTIENWDVTRLKRNEFYALNFLLFYEAEEFRFKLIWNLENYIELDKSTFNYTDNNGLKQGQWIKQEIDTVIQNWTAINLEFENPDTGFNKSYGIDTNICKSVYFTGYYKNDKKENIWLVYNTLKKDKIKSESINFGNLIYQAYYKNDNLNGILKTYYSSGNIKSEIEFENGNANGKINCYFESGKLKYSGYMVFGEEFFNGSEYSEKGYKLKDRKFNYNQVLEDWTDLDDLLLRIVLN